MMTTHRPGTMPPYGNPLPTHRRGPRRGREIVPRIPDSREHPCQSGAKLHRFCLISASSATAMLSPSAGWAIKARDWKISKSVAFGAFWCLPVPFAGPWFASVHLSALDGAACGLPAIFRCSSGAVDGAWASRVVLLTLDDAWGLS
jgi:hypothetical protein